MRAAPIPRDSRGESGRSINLALADRGIHALQSAGVFADLKDALLPMRGRLIHHAEGGTSLQPYGSGPTNSFIRSRGIGSIRSLIDIAARRSGVTLHFEHRFEAADFGGGTARIRDLRNDRLMTRAHAAAAGDRRRRLDRCAGR